MHVRRRSGRFDASSAFVVVGMSIVLALLVRDARIRGRARRGPRIAPRALEQARPRV